MTFARVLERGSFVTVLIAFSLLFPTAYYYGASRGTVLAAIVSVITVFAMRVRTLASRRERIEAALLALAICVCLWSLYGLRDVGGRTREMAYFVLSSPFFARYAGVTACLAAFTLWFCFARAADRSRRDLVVAGFLGVASLLLECHGKPALRYLLPAVAMSYAFLRAKPETRFVATRFFLGVIALTQFYEADPLHVTPMLVLASCLALSLRFWRRFFPEAAEARATASGLTLAIACYFMLWPTLGMRFSGIDFHFMFSWVPSAGYDELWWLIGLGMLVKLAWPFILLADLAAHFVGGRARAWLCIALAARLLALSVFAAWYGTDHGLLSNGALEILAELALLVVVSAFAWPSPLRVLEAIAADFAPRPAGGARDSLSPLRASWASRMMSLCASRRSSNHDPECVLPSPIQAGRAERD
jgi:hypothetical protein